MARPLRIEFPGAFYHVIQRGIERKNIFASESDKRKFLFLLDAAHVSYGAVFHSYVLMDNHYHLILETPRSPLNKIMHYINAGYAAYFNTKYKRAGPLYQGRFKAVLVQQDEYLHYLSCYIHLNPVRAGIVRFPQEYAYSSYSAFVSDKVPPQWLNTGFILSMFDKKAVKAKSLYKQFVISNIGKEKDIINQHTKLGILLGNEDFVARIKERFIGVEEKPEVPLLKKIQQKNELSLESIKSIAERIVNNDKRLTRSLSIYLSRKHTGRTLREIADFYGGIKYTGVSQVWRRMEIRKGADKKIAQIIIEAEEELDKVSNVKT
ncbi:MAG: transposase [Candidatus Omnitrophota bacterium]